MTGVQKKKKKSRKRNLNVDKLIMKNSLTFNINDSNM